jgi:dolichol-phosphate mannosyltransferase
LKKIVIIPTYKEQENIASMLQTIFSLAGNYHVLVIDDNSPDGTARIVKELCSINPNRLFLIERPGKLGLGTAYLTGFKWALEHGYDYVFEMDADFSHDPNDLERLFEACYQQGADVAVGSRYIRGGQLENWPLQRKIISKCGALYSRFITWIPVKDPTAGFICYRSSVLQAINLSEIKSIGYAFQIEMKYAAWKLGFVIKEVPIVFRDRLHGASKMTKGIIQEGIKGVLKLQLESLQGIYVRRIKRIVPESGSL